jgi:hypothetical protein
MSRRTNYDLRNNNGSTVWLNPNPGEGLNNIGVPNVYASSTVQLYPIGAQAKVDNRNFVYCLAAGAILGNSRLLVDSIVYYGAGGTTTSFEGNVHEAQAVGNTEIEIEDTADRVKDYYKGGYIILFHADGVKSTTIRIEGNTAATSVDEVTLQLESPLPWALANHDFCSIYTNPYKAITQSASTHFETFMGVALVACASASYFWMQTDGPAWLAQYGSTANPGYTADYRDAYAWYDGTVKVGATAGALQRVGTVLGKHASTYGDTFINMQLGLGRF